MKPSKNKKNDILDKNLQDETDTSEAGVSNRVEAQRLLDSSMKLERSRMNGMRVKMRMAYITAIAAGVIAIALAVAVSFLTPLKTVEPYVIKVDNDTGATQVERPLDATVDADEAMERFFLRQYVNARERYGWFSVEADFNRIRLMSTNDVFQQYARIVQSENGPLKVLGENGRAVVDINSITFLDLSETQQTAQVRFEKKFQTPAGKEAIARKGANWIATIAFDYSKSDMTKAERNVNPLNFRVTDYRLDRVKGGR